jgi:stress-induced-phosphoprotein 1
MQAKGNAAFSAGKFEEAIQHFTDAISVDPNNHVLYSNRSACFSSLMRYQEALDDAEKVVSIKPDWAKGYSRKGAALHGLRRFEDAVAAFEKGLEYDASNAQLKQGLADAKAASAGPAATEGWGSIFSSPEYITKLSTDPRTKPLMVQPDFLSMIRDVNANPRNMEKYLTDERFQEALAVGIEMAQGGGDQKPSAAAAAAAGGEPRNHTAEAMAAAEEIMRENAAKNKAAAEEKVHEDTPMTEEEKATAAAKVAAQKEKEAGNEAYKKKEFEAAISHYNKAIELFDGDISFLTNRAAVKFEQGDLEGCIADCEAAVDRGRELRADYKLIARAMTRKGNALVKKGDLTEAIEVYNRSLTEHRNADTLKRLQEAEKALKEANEVAYIDSDKCAEEKELGNAAFKAQKYPEAVTHYSEALKRGPAKVNSEAYKLFSNRAACYTKLGAWNEGLKDADECIRLAPDFAKGYSRKGHLQFFMKEFDKAMTTYETGLKHDPENAELKEGLMRCVQAINKMNRGDASEEDLQERQAKAMADPEVQSILSDPVMRQVLSDMQEDPISAQRHMKHPEVASKINKLISAGVIQVR